MSNDLVIAKNFGAVSKVFGAPAAEDELSAGIGGGFGVMSYRGKVWRQKFRGEETDLMREDGDGPRASIEVVIVKSAPNISKIFYEAGYEEGSSSAPDCWSTNGLTPDAGASKKQANTCAGCPKNAWGSRITESGKQGKACADSKRLAIVPAGDIDNETFGGPMLLRIPAASLQDIATFSRKLGSMGYPYYAVATRVSFDIKEAFPKLVFGAIRALTDEEAEKVVALREDQRVSRILNEEVVGVQHDTLPRQETPETVFEQPPQKVAAKPVQAKVEQPAKPKVEPKADPKPQAKATPAQTTKATDADAALNKFGAPDAEDTNDAPDDAMSSDAFDEELEGLLKNAAAA